MPAYFTRGKSYPSAPELSDLAELFGEIVDNLYMRVEEEEKSPDTRAFFTYSLFATTIVLGTEGTQSIGQGIVKKNT